MKPRLASHIIILFHLRRRDLDLDSLEDDEDSGEGSFGDGLYIPQEQTIGDCLEDGKVIKSFWELRQEVYIV